MMLGKLLQAVRPSARSSRHLACVVLLMVGIAVAWGQVTLPDGWETTGELAERDGWLVAQEAATVSGPIEAGTETSVLLRMGALERPVTCTVGGDDGEGLELRMQALDVEYRVGLIGKETIPLPDSCVELRVPRPGGGWLFRNQYFIRPHPHWYRGEERAAVLERWDELPPASAHPLELRMDAGDGRVGLWVDDRYVAGAAIGEAHRLQLTLSPGNAISGIQVAQAPEEERYVRVGLRGYGRPGSWGAAEPSLPQGLARADAVPFDLGSPDDRIDVGLSRWLAEAEGPEGFTENYFTRSAFDSRPESILLAIPTDDYCHAHLLCAVAPDPAKTPVLSLRLTRLLEDMYDSGGRGRAIADSSIRLQHRDGRWPDGCTQVGTVTATTPQGRIELPLLHVAVPLRSGHIQDVLEEEGIFYRRSTQHLDLELTRELHLVKTSTHSHHSILPVGPPSGVHVLALTLERAPVKARVRSRQVGHVFYESERPALYVEMTNRRDAPFSGTLSWRIRDFYGHRTEGRRHVTVHPDDEVHAARIDLHHDVLGWFGVELSLRDSDGRVVWEHPTSFAILPPDTRQAEDSPFGTWWFRRIHVGTDDAGEVAPLLRRMGFRKVSPSGRGPDAAELARHGLRISMLPDFARRGERAFEMLDEAVAAHPEIEWAMVFHECGFGRAPMFPPEFLGREVPELTEEQREALQEWIDRGVAYSQYCREKHPHLKLVVGNSSLDFAAQLMREGYPREHVDAFGDEDLGQAIPPEAPPAAFKSIYWLREYADLYDYDVPVTACYEWRGRGTQPGNLTELEQAQLYVRDALQALAFGAPHINLGLIHDVGDSYYYSRYGASGFCRRYPLLSPKISYVAMATLTRELDGAQYTRFLDTGSPSLYAMEFARDAGLVYALWLPRGRRTVEITFASDTGFTLTDMNGNARHLRTRDRRAEVVVSASPSYLRTDVEVEALRAGPTECAPPPADRTVVDALTDRGRWNAVRTPDEQLETVHFAFPRHLGDIDLQVAADERMGEALELTLQPQPDVPWPVSRYVVLEAGADMPAPGEPTAVGLWVRGNSCWGRIFWELQDAEGESFYSIGAPCGGWSVGDWQCDTFINFDGWNYLSVELPFEYESGFYAPPAHNWTHTGGDGRVDYPIRFTRLVVEMRDRVLHLTQPIEVPDRTIRLRDLSVSYQPHTSAPPIM